MRLDLKFGSRVARSIPVLSAALVFSAVSLGQAPNFHSGARDEKFEELGKKAQAQEKVRILISLHDPEREPEATLRSRGQAAVEAQRLRIRAKQLGILRSIQVREDDPAVRLFHFGAVAVPVNAHQLKILRDHPDVADVGEPRVSRPSP